MNRQRTISKKVKMSGIGIHTGKDVSIALTPLPPDSGIIFRRVDINENIDIPATIDYVVSSERGTNLARESVEVKTVEHLLSSLYGLGIDNVLIENEGGEIPAGDGSANDFVKLIDSAGIKEQAEEKNCVCVAQPVYHTDNDILIAIYPDDNLSLSYTISFGHKFLDAQYAYINLNENEYRTKVANARTFVFHNDVEALMKSGLIKGGSTENAIVITDDGLLEGELRSPLEFVYHKISDLIGDLCLTGVRLKGRIVAIKAGHKSHIDFVRKLKRYIHLMPVFEAPNSEPIYDIDAIKGFLPHRFPFLFVDKITYIEGKKRVIGVKNVTFNEPFFCGHFPTASIMPGVLIQEAMAQVGGMLLLTTVDDPSTKLVYFLGIDKAKFRKTVVPGDTLVFDLTTIRLKRNICEMRGEAFVRGELVAEGEFKAMVVDK
jgi:UDP-3-O-[3-hydroxymyristoyl] N-acetylglucosamine deacetylase/3-hydroxyacyl-[acyl-carrier-protein] dehydratase